LPYGAARRGAHHFVRCDVNAQVKVVCGHDASRGEGRQTGRQRPFEPVPMRFYELFEITMT
jgi:hypothetical protein